MSTTPELLSKIRELETELRAVLRRAPPEPLGDRQPVCPQGDLGPGNIGLGDRGLDELQHQGTRFLANPVPTEQHNFMRRA